MGRLWDDYGTIMGRFNARQLLAVEYVVRNERITREEFISLTKVTKSTAHRDLRKVVDKKIFVRKGKGSRSHYTLSDEIRVKENGPKSGAKT